MNNFSGLKQITSNSDYFQGLLTLLLFLILKAIKVLVTLPCSQSDAVRTVVDPDKQNNIIKCILFDWTVQTPDNRLTTDNPLAIPPSYNADINEVISSFGPDGQILLRARHLTVRKLLIMIINLEF